MPHPQLDHLILFVPPSPSSPSTPHIPSSLSNNFALTPGGVHADGLTANTLILLADGCYIEIICFVGPPSSSSSSSSSATKTHWWGGPNASEKRGWTDWCLTTPPSTSASENYDQLKNDDGTGQKFAYAPPQPGARRRPDGVEVKWEVTFPAGANGGQEVRGLVPFWCHDVGDRGVRVPIDAERVRHPSGVTGVKEVTVLVREEGVLGDVRGLYEGLFGEAEGRGGRGEFVFGVGRVRGSGGAKVVLRLARTEEEVERCEGKGWWFGDVVLEAEAVDGVLGREKGRRVRLDGDGDAVLGGLWVEYV